MSEQTQDVASQTEVPIPGAIPQSDPQATTPAAKPPFNKKILIGIVLLLIIVVFIVGFVFLSGNSKSAKVDSLSGRAHTAILKGDYKEARKELSEALQIDKDDPVLLSQMINSYALESNQTGDIAIPFKSAEPYINEALNTNPDNIDVLIAVGYAYETQGDIDKAKTYYVKATEIDSQSADAWFHLGHALQFQGKDEDAKKNFDKAYALDPNHPQILMVRGNMFFSEGKNQEAYESFKKASEDSSLDYQSRAEALVGASIARVNQEDFKYIDEAVELSKEAVALSPKFSPALAAYGYNLYLAGKQRTGFDYVVKATEANERISRNYFLLSMIYRNAKDYTYAIAAGKEAVEHVDDDNTILSKENRMSQKALYKYELAKTYSLSGLNVDTTELLLEAIELNPAFTERIKENYEKGTFFQKNISNTKFQSIISV